MPDHDDLDPLLDSALHDYAEPRTGLEQRVLARVAQARRNSELDVFAGTARRHWLAWAIPLSVAAALLLALLPMMKTKHPVPGQPATPQRALVEPITPQLPRARSTRLRVPFAAHGLRRPLHAPSETAQREPLPKLDIFPTQHPLTPEEQSLLTLGQHGSPELRRSLVDPEKSNPDNPDAAPLSIAAIHIQPLELPPAGVN